MQQNADSIEALLNITQLEWEEGIVQVNNVLRSYGREHDERLGTTLTAILLFNGRYLIAHVGDTRVYRFEDGAMTQITDDQTWVARELARGAITPAQARNHPKKNVILQSVGTQSDIQPVFLRGDDVEGASYMICCDGYRNELFDDEVQATFGDSHLATEEQLYEKITELADLALSRRELDNITAVVVSHQAGDGYVPALLSDERERLVEIDIMAEGKDGPGTEAVEATGYLGEIDWAAIEAAEADEAPQTTTLDGPEDITEVLDDGMKAGE